MTRTRLSIALAVVVIALALIAAYFILKPSDETKARTVATTFVQELQNVSLTQDTEALRSAIAARYAPYVTPELLAEWQADPSFAPGRETSSPWPDRIFIKSATQQGDSFVLNADILYVTSVEAASPEEDAAGVKMVVMQIIPTDDGWRIAAFEELFSEDLEEVEGE